MGLKPAIGKRAFVPYSLLGPAQIREAKRSLVFSEMSMDTVAALAAEDGSGRAFQKAKLVTIDECIEVAGGYSFPRAWAVENLPNIEFEDRTVFPAHNIDFPGTITPRDDKQVAFFGGLVDAATKPGPQDILANATTGAGKTVSSIYLGMKLRTPTLIVVDSNKIASGWLKNFRQFFGDEWARKYVGRVQQDLCDYKGKAFTITLAQSLASRRYAAQFYRAFGLLVIDEVQVFGGPHFSPILHMFPSRVRSFFTAENRKGQLGRLIQAHTGKPRVVSKQEVLKPDAWIITNKVSRVLRSYSDGVLYNEIASDKERNKKLAKLIKTRGYDRGRVVLVLSCRVGQLLSLKNLLVEELGVPEDTVGIHVGSYQTDNYVVYYTYPGSTKRNRLTTVNSYSKGRTMLSNIKRGDQSVMSDLPKSLCTRIQAGDRVEWELAREQYSPSQSELDNITNLCTIILATDKIFAKGVDVPRIDMGVEATPFGNVKQPLGRVLRIMEGKKKPEWYAIHDTVDLGDHENLTERTRKDVALLNKFFNKKTAARVAALRKAGARIKYQ